MAYIEAKSIKGRLYKYRRVSYRTNGKVKHTSKYVGPVEPVRKRRKGQGRKPSIFVRKPDDNGMRELIRESKSTDSFRQGRAKIVLLSAKGMDVNEICKRLSRWRKSVITAIREFNSKGLKFLDRGKAKGAEPTFTREQRTKILEAALTEPKLLGLHFTTWSLPKLRKYAIDKGVVDNITIETVRQILRKEGVKLRKSKRWQYSNDPELFKKTRNRRAEG